MKTLRDYLGMWVYEGPNNQLKYRGVYVSANPKGTKEYYITWGTKEKTLIVDAVVALARALSYERGGYKLEVPLTSLTAVIPASADLTIDEMFATRSKSKLGLKNQSVNGFTWKAWLNGENFE